MTPPRFMGHTKPDMTAPEASAVRTPPRRIRPFEGTQLRVNPLLRRMMGRDPCPTREEYDRYVEALWEGDPPMDALLAWLEEVGPRRGRALFEQALAQGIDAVPDAPEPLRAFFEVVDREPTWLDREQLDAAARFLHGTGLVGPYVLRDFALMGGYLLSGFNHALILTGALHKGAAQRIAETGKWWVDCTERGGLERFGPGFATTLRVRLVHAMVRRNLPLRAEWDNTQWGLPVNQTDMLATYLAFGPIMLVGMRAMGIPVTRAESRAVMHLWKYAGWLMGVDERWLVDEEREGLVRLFQTFLTQSPPDWTSEALGRALAEEPLERRYPLGDALPAAQELVRRLRYHQHLSNSSLFLTPKQMKKLGLPEGVRPWFPLAMLVPNFVRYGTQRLHPALRRRQERLGRRAQLHELRAMFGGREQDIIRPEAHHPAHL